MSEESDRWREWINKLRADILPEDGENPPAMESISTQKGIKSGKQKFYVQKIVTEVYIYTDIDGQRFGQETFQDMTLLGEMTANRLLRMIDRKRKKTQDS